MDVRRAGARLEFEGILDEQTVFEPIRQAWIEAAKASPDGCVELDFSQVKKANSVGLLGYTRILHGVKAPVVYVNAPVWLVEQFLSVAELLPRHASVKSIQARFYSPNDDTMTTRVLEIGSDVPLQTSYSDFELHVTTNENNPLEPDFEPETYFSFLTILTLRQGAGKK